MLGISCNRIVMRQPYETDRNMEFCPQRVWLEATDDAAQYLTAALEKRRIMRIAESERYNTYILIEMIAGGL